MAAVEPEIRGGRLEFPLWWMRLQQTDLDVSDAEYKSLRLLVVFICMRAGATMTIQPGRTLLPVSVEKERPGADPVFRQGF
jgi:hypothetical protein